MNSLSGHISDVKVNGSLSLVAVDVGKAISLQSIVIETPETASYLKKGKQINVLFKETEVVIGTAEDHAISLQNRIIGVINSIEKGELICRVVVHSSVGEIVAIISTRATEHLELRVGKEVCAMVKLNEIMLSE